MPDPLYTEIIEKLLSDPELVKCSDKSVRDKLKALLEADKSPSKKDLSDSLDQSK